MGAEETAEAASADDSDACPVGLCAEILCQKWTALILRDLTEGPCYYNDLMASVVGITPRVLCQRLERLQEHGIVSRRKINGMPPRTEYSLTERGHALIAVVSEMERFGRSWLMDRERC